MSVRAEAEKSNTPGLTPAQFEAAELGFFQLLRRKRMSPPFIDRNGEDLFGQACFEYSRQIAEGKRIDRPIGWIITCGWNRTVGLLESRDWRPQMVSVEQIGELEGEPADTPEASVLTEDRYRKVRTAVERLPDYQRRLLAHSYFEEESVREAARQLGWTPSKAQRAHETAQRRLRKLLGVEASDELAIIGLAAFASVTGDRASTMNQALGGLEGVLDGAAHLVARAWGRTLGSPGQVHRLQDPTAAVGRSHPLGPLARRAAGGDVPSGLIGRGARRVSEAGQRLMAGSGMETTSVVAEGGGRAAEACKFVAVCLIGGGTAFFVAPNHRQAPPHPGHRRVASVRPARAPSRSPLPVAGERPARSRVGTETATPTRASQPASFDSTPSVRAIKSATPATGGTSIKRQARQTKTEEGQAAGEFGAFQAAAEEAEHVQSETSESAPASEGSVDLAKSTTGSSNSSSEQTPREKGEEAQVQKQFGLP